MSAEPNWEEISKDKEAKKKAVINHIISKCHTNSEHELLRAIGTCLDKNGKIEIDILTGGLANYTYKIKVTHCQDCDDKYLFAKLSFPYAMLFPDKPCPLSRTENEYEMMKTFHKLAPGCVAAPLFCDDIGDDMKLLVTEWSHVDEQFANQFIDGAVDPRTADRIAQSLASLHSTDVDMEFNSKMRPWFSSLTPILQNIFDDLFHSDGKQDRVSTLARELGKETINSLFESYQDTIDQKECLCHGDLHAFNLLVGAKPAIETLERFDTTGDVVFVDFEMSHAGVAGHDLGTLRAFPIACAFAHSINGHRHSAHDILNWLNKLWDQYEMTMHKSESTELYMTKIFRDSLKYTALYLLAAYKLNIHVEFLPIGEGRSKDVDIVKESTGVAGLECFQLSMSHDLTLNELKHNFQNIVEKEMAGLLQRKRIERNRRSSVLRASGRRVSDANLHFANLHNLHKDDRYSFVNADGNVNGDLRASYGKLETLVSNNSVLEEEEYVTAAAQ